MRLVKQHNWFYQFPQFGYLCSLHLLSKSWKLLEKLSQTHMVLNNSHSWSHTRTATLTSVQMHACRTCVSAHIGPLDCGLGRCSETLQPIPI